MNRTLPSMERTKEHNVALLHQVDDLLRQFDNADLTTPRALLFGGSVGQHVRHIVEYYDLLLSGWPTGEINYDRRERDRRVETDVAYARRAIDRCLDLLRGISADQQLVLESELPADGGTVSQTTSLMRELTYVADHCVHHLAMVRIVVEQELHRIVFPADLGVAAATHNHRAR